MSDHPPSDVCPTCKQLLAVVFAIGCDGHSFPAIWRCPEHGAVPPMRSAVVNDYPAGNKKPRSAEDRARQ